MGKMVKLPRLLVASLLACRARTMISHGLARAEVTNVIRILL